MNHRIKELIKEKGYTQTEVAQMLGITQVRMYQITAGKPQYATMERIATLLGVQMWELFASREEILMNGNVKWECPKCGAVLEMKK